MVLMTTRTTNCAGFHRHRLPGEGLLAAFVEEIAAGGDDPDGASAPRERS
jgi:hypothetical protein